MAIAPRSGLSRCCFPVCKALPAALLCWSAAMSLAQETAPPGTGTAAKTVRGNSLEEVVVTARRRQESLQETPIAVTAFSADDLQERGIINVQELTKSVPSLEITEGVANLIYLRGIGQRTAFARVDPTVGVYLDNIYLPRADGQLLDTVDVENIQVLRGPQGTLFGKNTTGGAIVVALEKPDSVQDGYVFGSLGNYGRWQLRAATNLPLSDRLSARFAVNALRDDGFMQDVSGADYNSKNRQSALAQLRWEATADLSLDALFYYGKIDEKLAALNCRIINENGVLMRGLYLLWPGDTEPSNPTAYRENCEANSRARLGDLRSNLGDEPLMDKKLDTYLAAATMDWSLTQDFAVKLVAGARREVKGPVASSDQDGGPLNFNESFSTQDSDRDSFSVELQLNGSLFNDRVSFTAGLFGMLEINTEEFTLINSLNGIDAFTLSQIASGTAPTQPPLGGTQPLVGILVDPILKSDFDLENRTRAAFVQASWDVTEQLEFTAGVRWTSEQRISDLAVFAADRDAIGQRIFLSGQGFGPPVEGFNPYLGPLRWLADPVQLAMNLFPDADGDGLHDFPMKSTPERTSSRDETFRKVTPMVSLSYQVPSDWLRDTVIDGTMVYGTWSTGFKSGFFEPRGVDGLATVEPEEVENREIGVKIDAFQRSVRLNMAAYSMDFDNQQLIQVDADSANNLIVIFDNAGRSEILGAELELLWMPSQGLMLNLSLSKNRYKFTEFEDNDLLQAVLGRQVVVDRTDEPFPVSPEETAAIGVQYAMVTGLGIFTPRVDYSYKSDVYYGLDDGAFEVYKRDPDLAGQSAYAVLDLRLSWQSNDDTVTAAAFVKNATDERYRTGAAAVADSVSNFFDNYGEPRMYGVELRKRF